MNTDKRWRIDRRRPEKKYEPIFSFWYAYDREVKMYRLMNPTEERSVGLRARAGELEAREELVVRNLRLVRKIARDYSDMGLSLFDLIGEGNIGLMEAAERFDPDKGKFSSFASIWIKRRIKRALSNHSRTIRIPVWAVDTLTRLAGASRKLEGILCREPNDDELALETGMSPARVEWFRSVTSRMVSFEELIWYNGTPKCYADVIPDDGALLPGDRIQQEENLELLNTAFSYLSEREQIILSMRYDLTDTQGEKTLEEIGQKFGLTRERVRQIGCDALKSLKKLMEKLEKVST